MSAPCGKCTKRPPGKGCGQHAVCEEYLEYWKARKEENKKAFLENESAIFLTHQKIKSIRRNRIK